MPLHQKLLQYCGVTSIGEIRWAHAVNSQQRLVDALEDGSIHFLEVDINVSSDQVIAATHEAGGETDLTFETLIKNVRSSRKGLKLDFKNDAVIAECLDMLRDAALTQPVILNADILSVKAADPTEIDGSRFIANANQKCPDRLLSLGWRTSDTSPSYTVQDIEHMLRLCVQLPEVTFPARASMLPNSWTALSKLLDGTQHSLTIWDINPVDAELQKWIEKETDPKRCFYDYRLV